MKNIIILMIICTTLLGCATSYHVNVLSVDVQTMNYSLVPNINPQGLVIGHREVPEGIFKAGNIEKAMRKANEAGYTKIISVESGTNLFLGIVGTRWVRIRCVKE